ncbi:unnamed protein product [Lathyrus sativus]|nr:unnamed protein product [Lathyrus sativus]
MTMPNKKANQNDRISDLPGNVIDAILANLRIRDQVRTSILSTKWRYMWTSAPHLCFDDDFCQRFLDLDDPSTVISEIITDVLMIHNGPIHKFSIYLSIHYDFMFSMENLNTWIPFMSKDIKHLELVAPYANREDEMADILFSCKELTYLKFSFFNLLIPNNFRSFKKLLELHLNSIEFDSSSLESFMSGCPLLEKLSIAYCYDHSCDYLVISSPSLKVLMLESTMMNLICLKGAKNLIDFTLKGFLNIGFIKSLPEIKRFSLTNWGKYDVKIPPMLATSSFSSLEYLKLDDLDLNDKGDILYLVRVLKSAPSLIELVIKQSYNYDDTTQVSDYSEELECLSCNLKLQTVDVYFRANSQYAMSLIQFILVNSPLLKILTLDYSSIELDAAMFRISQDLLLMERALARINLLPCDSS